MAREIKFRAWVEEENEMLPVEEMIFCEVGGVAEINDWWGDSRFILMQYTGLKDKNGVEIYEGDIVEIEPNYGGDLFYGLETCVVKWDNEEAMFYVQTSKDGLWNRYSKVIGNIYENPELLEVEE